jgi:predicted cobalt transporter CbtA
MMFGPPLLAVFDFLVVKTGNGWLTVMDAGFLAVLFGLILARWLEFRSGSPQPAEGQPATPEHLRRYIIGVIVIGLVVWVVANILGNYVMTA